MDVARVEAQDCVRLAGGGAPAVRDVAGGADQVVRDREVHHVGHVGAHLVGVQDSVVRGRGGDGAELHGLGDVPGLDVVEVDRDGAEGLALLGRVLDPLDHGVHGRGQSLDPLDTARALEHGLTDHHHVHDLVAIEGFGVEQVDDVVARALVGVATVEHDEGLGGPTTEGLELGVLAAGELRGTHDRIEVLEGVGVAVLVGRTVDGAGAPEQVLGHGELGTLDGYTSETSPGPHGLLDQDLVGAIGPRGREHGHGGIADTLLALEGHGQSVGVGDGHGVGASVGEHTEAGDVLHPVEEHVHAELLLELAHVAVAHVDVVERVGRGQGGPAGVEGPGQGELGRAAGGLDRVEQDFGGLGRDGVVAGVGGGGGGAVLDVAGGHTQGQADGHQGEQGVSHDFSLLEVAA